MSSSKTKIIGLTGGIGTGKSTASEYLVSRGLRHIDADAISRQITEKREGEDNPVLEEIGQAFGPEVFREDGSMDRPAMARLVFSDPQRKKELESILFRHIIEEIREQIGQAERSWGGGDDCDRDQPSACGATSPDPVRAVLLDVPLLFESGLDSLCDRVMVVTAEEPVRIRRVMDRDGCTEEEVRARMANQMPEEEKISRGDLLVDNSGDLQHLHAQLEEILRKIQY